MTDVGPLTAAEIWEEFDGQPLAIAESHAVVPKKGKMFFETTDPKTGQVVEAMKIAVIRPCVSRGKKIRGLPPIYTPNMLAENAAVFTDWPMYEDHVSEELVENFREQLVEAEMGDLLEFLEERARRIKELGGRVIRSYFNPDLVFESDGEEGYQRSGVEALAVPQPGIRSMLEADPGILHTSINAWPTGAKPGKAPWDAKVEGMLIDGIRPRPRGSVDWVFRGGAGGRPILEQLAEGDRDVAVTMLEAFYSAEHEGTGPLAHEDKALMDKLKDLKPGQLREFLQSEAPHLVEALAPDGDGGSGSGSSGGEGEPLTAEQVREMLTEQRTELESSFEKKLEEHDEQVETEVQERLQERTQAERLSKLAEKKIAEAQRNGLPREWAENLRTRYTVFPSGPAAGLVLQESDLKDDEDKEISDEQAIENRLHEDLQHCSKLIEAAGGTPIIRGQGPSSPDPGAEQPTGAPVRNLFRNWLAETGEFSNLEENETEDQRVAKIAGGNS